MSQAVEQVNKQLEAIGLPRTVRWTLGQELLTLSLSLQDDEQVRALAVGEYKSKKGVLAATDRRLIFAGAGFPVGRSESFPYHKVLSVDHEIKLMGGTVTVHASGNSAQLTKARADLVIKVIEVFHSRETPAAAPDVPAPTLGVADELAKLNELREAGVLSEEEFARLKARLVS